MIVLTRPEAEVCKKEDANIDSLLGAIACAGFAEKASTSSGTGASAPDDLLDSLDTRGAAKAKAKAKAGADKVWSVKPRSPKNTIGPSYGLVRLRLQLCKNNKGGDTSARCV